MCAPQIARLSHPVYKGGVAGKKSAAVGSDSVTHPSNGNCSIDSSHPHIAFFRQIKSLSRRALHCFQVEKKKGQRAPWPHHHTTPLPLRAPCSVLRATYLPTYAFENRLCTPETFLSNSLSQWIDFLLEGQDLNCIGLDWNTDIRSGSFRPLRKHIPPPTEPHHRALIILSTN